ncbi:MAG: LysR family transcriptional regulator [Duodenibacillus sp.]|nr:LysR family transcriptional regulator [Duodenibacillus sp.]
MYDRHLDYFIASADYGTFTQAAARFHISPNALIKHINQFEHRVGVKLFERTRRGVVLTEAGKSLYRDARVIREQANSAMSRARAIAGAKSVVIRLGASLMCPAKPAVRVWSRVSEEHPGIRLEIVPTDDSSYENLSPTGSGNSGVDIIAGIIPSTLWANTCEVLEISSEPVALAMPLGHRLAARPVIHAEDLFGETVMVVRRHNSSYIDRLRDFWEQNFPQIRIEDVPPYDISVFNRCAAEGKIMVSTPIWSDVHPGLVTVPYEAGERFPVPYGLIYATPPAAHLTEFLASLAKAVSLGRQGL